MINRCCRGRFEAKVIRCTVCSVSYHIYSYMSMFYTTVWVSGGRGGVGNSAVHLYVTVNMRVRNAKSDNQYAVY